MPVAHPLVRPAGDRRRRRPDAGRGRGAGGGLRSRRRQRAVDLRLARSPLRPDPGHHAAGAPRAHDAPEGPPRGDERGLVRRGRGPRLRAGGRGDVHRHAGGHGARPRSHARPDLPGDRRGAEEAPGKPRGARGPGHAGARRSDDADAPAERARRPGDPRVHGRWAVALGSAMSPTERAAAGTPPEHMVRLDVDDRGIATIAMGDVAGHNAMSEPFVRELSDALAALAACAEARVAVLLGLPETFSAGASRETLQAILDGKLAPADIVLPRAVLDVPVPVIAAMEGHAVGGGLA